MPAISAPATVLVTGANGFIAVYVVKSLLKQNFKVRGTVRSTAKGDYLKNLFAEYGDRFEYVIVPDVNAPGAFDKVVDGVDAIAHLSAPLPQIVEDAQDMIRPGVEGTIALLDSVKNHGHNVKRIVVTSTAGAAWSPKDGPYTFTENDWDDFAVKTLTEQGSKANPVLIYYGTKTLEEKAALDYVQRNKGSINFDMTTLLPTYVFGPPMHNIDRPKVGQFGTTEIVYGGLTQTPVTESDLMPWPEADSYIDVRDVAELHVLSLTTEAAGGERFLLFKQNFSWQDAYDVLNSVEPKLQGVPVGTPGSGKGATFMVAHDNSKVDKIFHYKYHSFEDTIVDSWREFVKRGWIDGVKA